MMLQDAQARFPELVGDLLWHRNACRRRAGYPGRILYVQAGHEIRLGPRHSSRRSRRHPRGLIFGRWVSSGDYFPLLAGFGELSSRSATIFLHFAVALLIGVTFGLLFQRDVRSYGSCMDGVSDSESSGGFSGR